MKQEATERNPQDSCERSSLACRELTGVRSRWVNGHSVWRFWTGLAVRATGIDYRGNKIPLVL